MASTAINSHSVTRLVQGLPGDEVLLEADRCVVAGVPVRAASFPALVRMMVNCFVENGSLLDGAEKVPFVVFLMHRWFTVSTELAKQLISLHTSAETASTCLRSECSHSFDTKCEVVQLRLQVCHAIRYWVLNFPMQFDLENGLSNALNEFQGTLTSPFAELVDLSQVPSYAWMRHVSVRNNAPQTPLVTRKVSLVLNNLEPGQLAEYITSLEHKVIRRISFEDYKNYAYSGSLRETPRLEHSVALFNGLTQWIQCLVLSRTTPQQRADIIAKFVNVAKKLLEMQNFNSLMGVVGSVTHSVLARLSKTMACLPTCRKKLLSEFTDLLSSNNNFQNYRKALAECKGFKIPILGIHLKDLISLHTAMPDTVNDGLINVRKMAQLSLIFHELEELQMSAPPVESNVDVVNMLRLSLDLAYTDDEIYELSLAREPRNFSSPQCSPSVSNIVFAEWTGGPSPPPHPHTIEKHVTAMVDAVFNNYDTDRDGYISHEEFDAVATNFPFIASFCVLDADHDGMISHEEMRKYFIHANCHALKSRFNHEFQETTYFKPTFCAHCAGLLWGLIRQGYKCRDCSINAHKHCKDLVVMECRLRNTSTGESSSHAVSSRRRFRRKKKSSTSESESSASSTKNSSLSIADYDTWSHLSDSVLDGGGSLPPSPKTSGPRRKISDSLLVPSLNRAATRLKPQTSCPESCHHSGLDTAHLRNRSSLGIAHIPAHIKNRNDSPSHKQTSDMTGAVNHKHASDLSGSPIQPAHKHTNDTTGGVNPKHPSDTSGGVAVLPVHKNSGNVSSGVTLSVHNATDHRPICDVTEMTKEPQSSRFLLSRETTIREETDIHFSLGELDQHTQTKPTSKIQTTKTPAKMMPSTAMCPHSSCTCFANQLQKLQEVEEVKERLLKENKFLLEKLESAYKELNALREHVGEVRQQTVSFILSQMETLHIQKDTHL